MTKRKQRPECPSCSQPRFGWARGPDQLRPKEAWLWDNGPETQSCLSRTESMKILVSDVNTALALRCRREHVHRGRDCVHCEAGAPGWRVACQPLQHLGSTWWASSHATRVPRGRRSHLQGALHGSRGRCRARWICTVTVTDCSADGSKVPGKRQAVSPMGEVGRVGEDRLQDCHREGTLCPSSTEPLLALLRPDQDMQPVGFWSKH